jgi:hypothetical protein
LNVFSYDNAQHTVTPFALSSLTSDSQPLFRYLSYTQFWYKLRITQ